MNGVNYSTGNEARDAKLPDDPMSQACGQRIEPVLNVALCSTRQGYQMLHGPD